MSGAIEDPDEELLRQVHPSFLHAGRPSSQAFRPTPKDAGRLSVDRGSRTTARDSFERHTARFASVGVWAVTVAEVTDVDLQAHEEPLEENPAHAYIDFAGHSRNGVRRAATVLARAAADRGALYQVPPAGGEV